MRIIVRIINKILRVLYSIKRHYINLRPTIQIGKGTIIEKGAIISTRYGGTITIGENCHISRYGHILSCGGNIIIGNNSTVNPFAMVYGQGGLKIGNGVRIATQSTILPSNHIFDRKDIMIYEQGLSKKGIVIEDDVWVGANSVILPGVTLGKHCVVAAGSIVTHSVPPYSICAGCPAKVIKSYDFETNEWEKVEKSAINNYK